MHKKVKINVSNKIGVEFESDHETESEIRRKLATDPNISGVNQTKLIDAHIEHQKSIDKQKEGKIRNTGIAIASIGAAEVADQTFNNGETTRQLINFFEKAIRTAISYTKDATAKLFHK